MRRIDGNALRVMEELWRDHYHGSKRGLTSSELAENIGRSVVAVNEALKTLRENKPPLIIDGGTVHTGGKPARMHIIDIEAVITWPATATLVLRLFKYEGGFCSKQLLQEDIISMALTDPQTKRPFEPTRVEKQINFAVNRNYLAYVPEHDDLLSITERAREEWAYLDFISKDAGPPTSRSST